MSRPSWDEYGIILAEAAKSRAACTRRQVGAAILSTNHRVIGMGYNGTPSGERHCTDGGCPRGRHYRWTWAETEADSDEWVEICRCEKPWPCPDAVPSLSCYKSGPGLCTAKHAEINAIEDAINRGQDLYGATIYVTYVPCADCDARIRSEGIVKAVYPDA